MALSEIPKRIRKKKQANYSADNNVFGATKSARDAGDRGIGVRQDHSLSFRDDVTIVDAVRT